MDCIADFHVITLIIIIVIIGGLAGITNFLVYYYSRLKDNSKDIIKKYEYIKYIVSGIGAACLVPLLLNMLSSNLIKLTADFDNINYFVFAGFCFIAGYFSDRFINSMGEKILKDLEKTKDKLDETINSVKENEEKIDVIIASETETSDDEEYGIQNDLENLKIKSKFADHDAKTQANEIVKSFGNKYKFRTVKGISTELKYAPGIVEIILSMLMELGVVNKVRKDSKEYWALTKIGLTMREKLLRDDEVK